MLTMHTASYMRGRSIGLSDYLWMFNNDRRPSRLLDHEFEDLVRDESQDSSVITTWRISFDQKDRDASRGAQLLRLMSDLHWRSIPQYLLQQYDLCDEDDLPQAKNLVMRRENISSFASTAAMNVARAGVFNVRIIRGSQFYGAIIAAEKLRVNIAGCASSPPGVAATFAFHATKNEYAAL
ncbi:hypothetical protein BJ878DRAFT_5550 [Calycina marina]|uniref:Uncharacterized protein n=1 Tax=Calycina marina TaxID=1763456 RepID=A0A9P8CFX5_9HELO|nr:hypothetical protein BJ878DRAFT_5550 [Calycina marina]